MSRTRKDDPENTNKPLPEDDDLDDVELGQPACELGEECESCQ